MDMNLEDVFSEFYYRLKKYDFLGTKETKFAKLIARAPHLGREAWLHSVFKPITKKEVIELNNQLKFKLPEIYENFLVNCCNGFSIFGTTISLFGYRFNYIRDLDNIWQPFDIIKMNNVEKPLDATENHFFFGFYNWDGSKLYFETSTLRVYRCSRESVKPLNEWCCFEEMLLSEIKRLVELFDENGMEIDERRKTTPPR